MIVALPPVILSVIKSARIMDYSHHQAIKSSFYIRGISRVFNGVPEELRGIYRFLLVSGGTMGLRSVQGGLMGVSRGPEEFKGRFRRGVLDLPLNPPRTRP